MQATIAPAWPIQVHDSKFSGHRRSARRPRSQLRQQYERISVPGAEKVTNTDFSCAPAACTTQFPEVNSSWVDGKFQPQACGQHSGLLSRQARGWVSSCRSCTDADFKDIIQISIESRQVIDGPVPARAKATFSGLRRSPSRTSGMYGRRRVTRIINPPEAAPCGRRDQGPWLSWKTGRIVPGKVIAMRSPSTTAVF